jgi:hypothetical protein
MLFVIELLSKGANMINKICQLCGKNFVKDKRISYKNWNKQKYCSLQCSAQATIPNKKGKTWYKIHPRGMLGKIPWNKGKKLHYPVWNKGSKLLPKISGENSHKWKGGRFKRIDGYICVYAPHHPRVRKQVRKYIFEHILVAEKKLNRYLTNKEIVHHINGIRDDNRPENIVIVTRAKHLRIHKPHGW